MLPFMFKAKDNKTTSVANIDHATLAELVTMFGRKSSYTLSIVHPLNKEVTFTFEITQESLNQD